MLGDVKAIETGFVGSSGECKPLVKEGRERTVAVFDMIE